VLRYASRAIEIEGTTVRVAAGAVLQHLVDSAIAAGWARPGSEDPGRRGARPSWQCRRLRPLHS
jgi:hypothetical protein